jgi:hypothetical protein
MDKGIQVLTSGNIFVLCISQISLLSPLVSLTAAPPWMVVFLLEHCRLWPLLPLLSSSVESPDWSKDKDPVLSWPWHWWTVLASLSILTMHHSFAVLQENHLLLVTLLGASKPSISVFFSIFLEHSPLLPLLHQGNCYLSCRFCL